MRAQPRWYGVGVRRTLLLLAAACAGTPGVERAAPGSRPESTVSGAQPRGLGMNDVSILLPLPRDPQLPVLASAASSALIDPAWFDALVTARHDIAPRTGDPVALDDFQVVAIRFDLCDRSVIGACPAGVPGRLRLVLQPLYRVAGEVFAHDVALHAFYPIPAGDLAAVIAELRAMAQRQPGPPGAPLAVSPAAGDAVYLARLYQLVVRYARSASLERLTVIGQVAGSAAFAWRFRGLDRSGDGFAAMAIPSIDAAEQSMQVAGGDTIYLADRLADQPSGFALATNGARFAAAPPGDRVAALEALAAIQNPALHDTNDTQCIACHVASFLTARRAATSGIDLASLAGRFTSARNLVTQSIAATDPRVVRAFGWVAKFPAISQRVANDTAQVLSEIEARFPPRQAP